MMGSTVVLYVPEVDEAIARLIHHPALIVILGHRGKGKTALALRLQELLRDVAAPYAVGLPQKAARLLPSWNRVLTRSSTTSEACTRP